MSASSPSPPAPASSSLPDTHPDRPPGDALLLAMDTASPTVSVAVGRDGICLAARSVELRRSSEALLHLVDEALREAGVTLHDLDGIVALRGPGSFTGLRVGLATALGLHQALGTPATAVPTLEVIEVAARTARVDLDGLGDPNAPGGPVAAVVDALRGQWFVQMFPASRAKTEAGKPENAVILDPTELAAHRPALVAGFGAERLAEDPVWPPAIERLDLAEPAAGTPSLAAAALLLHARPPRRPPPWHPDTLTHPLYLRPPAVTLPANGP